MLICTITVGDFKGRKVTENGDILNAKTEKSYCKQRLRASGVMYVTLNGKDVNISTLVADAFLLENRHYPYIIHKDGNVKNNHYTNLLRSEYPDLDHQDFKPIPGYPYYKISKDSTIKSYYNDLPLIIKPYLGEKGYYSVRLIDEKGCKMNEYIHRLVAIVYRPNPKNLPEVDHKDRNKSNNHLNNLRWVTSSENGKNRTYNTPKKRVTEKYVLKSGEIALKMDQVFEDYKDFCFPTYKITNFGNVINMSGIRISHFQKEICPSCSLRNFENKIMLVQVHILVARYFVKGRTDEKYIVHHKNENRTDPHYTNLEWVTPSENSLKSAHKRRKRVLKIDPKTDIILGKYDSMKDAAKSIDVNNVDNIVSGISKCCKGIRKTAHGFFWEVIEST